jgi:colicin import membrane protein
MKESDFYQGSSFHRYLTVSLIGHAVFLIILVVGVHFSAPLPVLENTDKNDVISAIVLGETPNSKLLPQAPPPLIQKEEQKTATKQLLAERPAEREVAPAINDQQKPAALEKELLSKMQQDVMSRNILADIDKTRKDKKVQKRKFSQKALQAQFQKTLREQSEKSLRQQLIDDHITFRGTQTRQAQGEINKYKALILQSISEHWIVPVQSNKKSSCELMIRVAAGGIVLNVQITKTSGDAALDRSARAAVFKSSPLPVPSNAETFAAFRQFVLKVRPESALPKSSG